jgi:hypothetical protein
LQSFFQANPADYLRINISDAVERGNGHYNILINLPISRPAVNNGEEEKIWSLFDVLIDKGPFYVFVKFHSDSFVDELMETISQMGNLKADRPSYKKIIRFIYSLRQFDCDIYEDGVIGLFDEFFRVFLCIFLRHHEDFERAKSIMKEIEEFYAKKYPDFLSRLVGITGASSKVASKKLSSLTDSEWVNRTNRVWGKIIPKWVNFLDNFNWPLSTWGSSSDDFPSLFTTRLRPIIYNDNFDKPLLDNSLFLGPINENGYHPDFEPSNYLQTMIMLVIYAFRRDNQEINDQTVIFKFSLDDPQMRDKSTMMLHYEDIIYSTEGFTGLTKTVGSTIIIMGPFIEKGLFHFILEAIDNISVHFLADLNTLIRFKLLGDSRGLTPRNVLNLLRHRELEPIFQLAFEFFLSEYFKDSLFGTIPLGQIVAICLTASPERAKSLLLHPYLNIDLVNEEGLHLMNFLPKDSLNLLLVRLYEAHNKPYQVNPIQFNLVPKVAFDYLNYSGRVPFQEASLYIDSEGRVNFKDQQATLYVVSQRITETIKLYRKRPIKVYAGDVLIVLGYQFAIWPPEAEKRKVLHILRNILFNGGGEGMLLAFLDKFLGCKLRILK